MRRKKPARECGCWGHWYSGRSAVRAVACRYAISIVLLGVAASTACAQQRIADLYQVDPDSVKVFRMPNIRVVKISFPRRVSSGSPHDRDVHAGQQHVLLARLSIES